MGPLIKWRKDGRRSTTTIDSNGLVRHLREQDPEPTLKMAHHIREAGWNPKAEGRPIACYPTLVRQKWHDEWEAKFADKMTWHAFLAKKVLERENSLWRVSGALPDRIPDDYGEVGTLD